MLLLLRPRPFFDSGIPPIVIYGGRAIPSRRVTLYFERLTDQRRKKKKIVKVINRVQELYEKYEAISRKSDPSEKEIKFISTIRKRVLDEVDRVNAEDERIILILEELGLL